MFNKTALYALTLMAASAANSQNYDPAQVAPRALPSSQVQPIPNGVNSVANPGFEINGGAGTPVFSDWTVVDFDGGGETAKGDGGGGGGPGTWLVQTGSSSPGNGFPVNPPPGGDFAAMTDQAAPGSHVLYQDFVVPPGGGTLTFDLFISNAANDFISPPTLDPFAVPNQQFRADLMSPAADVFDVGAGVLANLYQTNPGDPLVSGYTTISTDVSAFAGQTVRLRFAEVDNQFFFNVGIDNVTLIGAQQVSPVPSLGLLGLLGMIVALLATVWWVRRH